MTELALRGNLAPIVTEYLAKREAIPAAVAAFEAAGTALKLACSVQGTTGREQINIGHNHASTLEKNLLKSAWLTLYDRLEIARLAPATDKKRFEQMLGKPLEFTFENLKGVFGPYLADPRHAMLRGLAEVFGDLDPFYKSHEKVKFGVKGLPKRAILRGVSEYGWGRDQLTNILNALAVYQGKQLVEWPEISALLKREDALLVEWREPEPAAPNSLIKPKAPFPARGVRLRRFANGNGHLIFEPETLLDINRALAEFYGDVLPDADDDAPARPRPGSDVAKDLQYYPTPEKVVDRLLENICIRPGDMVLEPSCGCGRFLDALKKRKARTMGIEVHPGRAEISRAKGHNVYLGNFLESVPEPEFDRVVMNPPFSGRHYLKHVEHALKWLKPGGVLTAILPATARYDHGVLQGDWWDLPAASFSESGTNISTTVYSICKR